MVSLSGISSVRHLYDCFLGGFRNKSLNSYYHILEKVGFKLVELELCVLRQLFQLPRLTKLLEQYPILFLVDDTFQPKLGKKFGHVKIVHDHARHVGKEFVNVHGFVTLAVAFPPMRGPAEQALKIVGQQQHIIFEGDSWYPKKDVLNFAKDHDNVDFIANIRKDTALYQLSQRTGK